MGRGAAEVEATQRCDSRLGIQGASPWHLGEKADCLLDFVYEYLCGALVFDPPGLRDAQRFACDVREYDLAGIHFDRSSRRTSAASVSRPASTSAPEATRARWSAARSSSSSQSPGTIARSSTSVPSGRSVGSSTTKRPFCTRAFSVMPRNVLANVDVDNWRCTGRAIGPSDTMQRTALCAVADAARWAFWNRNGARELNQSERQVRGSSVRWTPAITSTAAPTNRASMATRFVSAKSTMSLVDSLKIDRAARGHDSLSDSRGGAVLASRRSLGRAARLGFCDHGV